MSTSLQHAQKLDFKPLKNAIQLQFNKMVATGPIFQADIDKDYIYELYLDSFPDGTNPMFRNRTEHDCSCCRSFIRKAGSMVQIVDGQLTSIWDIKIDSPYQIVVDALADYVKSQTINNFFLHTENLIGTDQNRENFENQILTWHHFSIQLPPSLVCKGEEIGPRTSEFRAQHDVLLRSLKEIDDQSIDIVLDLISQNSLYRGAEKKKIVDAFSEIKKRYTKKVLQEGQNEDLFVWNEVAGPNNWVCKIKNDVIGTLLSDLSEGYDLEDAVKSFEDKVSGTNYKRPTALVTPKMRDDAKKVIEELGLLPSLDRQYAKLEHINIHNVLFADRSIKKKLNGDVFDEISVKTAEVKNLDKVEEITIAKFIADVLPNIESLEVFFDNDHQNRLVSLIAPYDFTAKQLFKWDNPFSWSYTGDVADSIKERVKAAGGRINADVCCRLAWSNYDDLDLHMTEDLGYIKNHIYYSSRKSTHTGGHLDVDMNAGHGSTRTPVENIYYPDRKQMKPGVYTLFVQQFWSRETENVGFEVELEVLGETHYLSYPNAMRNKQNVEVAKLIVDNKNITVQCALPSTKASKDLWGLKTGTFIPVEAVMLSPNCWDDKEIGNKHFFFMLNGCKNDGSARGFYNEFLRGELEPHRKTMELVGSKMRTEEGQEQMSGLGFSSTLGGSLVVKVRGSFTRMLNINL